MAYSEDAFAKASRNTPVRDELVVSLDDILPGLKSAEGIPVLKHTKRGQSESRRLRLDTDVSTLEVFRTSTGYLNRRMSSRTYNLRLLEEVGPASSVPGGLPANPGRTLVFVFNNRTLYVTVQSRDVCAALVALFRPAGGPSSHASPPSAGTAHASGDDADSGGRRTNASPSSPPSGPSVWAGPARGRRASDAGATVRSRERGIGARGVSAREFLGDESRRAKGGDDGAGNGYTGGVAGRRRVAHQDLLKRSASYTAVPGSFEVVGTSTSSSEDDMVVSTSMEVQHQHQPSETPPLSGRSGRSPTASTYSSESPEAMVRSRMIGFGSADLGIDGKQPKRGGRSSSFKAPWARFTDSDKKSSAAAVPTVSSTRLKNAGLAVEDKAPIADAGNNNAGAALTPDEAAEAAEYHATAGPANAPRGRDSASPLAVRFEDRLNAESLRRPASAPVVGVGPEGPEGSPARKARRRTANTSPSSSKTQARGGRTTSSPLRGRRSSPGASRAIEDVAPQQQQKQRQQRPSMEQQRPSAEQKRLSTEQQQPSTVTLQNEGGLAIAFPRRPEAPPPPDSPEARRSSSGARSAPTPEAATPPLPSLPRKEHEDHAVVERKIPPMSRPMPDWHQLQQRAARKAAQQDRPTVVFTHDSSFESSVSPQPAKRGSANGVRRRSAGGRLTLGQDFARSSSLDSLEGLGSHHQNGRPSNAGTLASFLGDEGRSGKAAAVVSFAAFPDVRGTAAPPDAAAGTPDRGRSKDQVVKEDTGRMLTLAKSDESDEQQHPSPGVAAQDARPPVVGANGAEGPSDDAGAGEGTASRQDVYIARLDTLGDSFGPPTMEDVVSGLTIETASSHEYVPPSAGTAVFPGVLPFSGALAPAFNSRGSRGSRGSYGRRSSGATDCTSPDSPPGGAVGEVRATLGHPPAARPIPLMASLHLGGAAPEHPQGPSGFEELWAVLEPAWGMNSSFGTSMVPKVMLLGDIYEKMRGFQAAVASVCVQACGPVLGKVCGRCGRAWAVLTSASPQSIAGFQAMHKIDKAIGQLTAVVARYEVSAVVRRFTLPLIGASYAWEELLSAGGAGDLHGPCQQIENAIALLPNEQQHQQERDGGKPGGGGGGGRHGGGSTRAGRRNSNQEDLRLPPCPSYWAKGQFDLLTPAGLSDVLTLLHEPARFSELAQLVTRASDVGPADREYSLAWDCVRQGEGPALGRTLRRALSATLVAAGELIPLPRVPPPPPAYVARERLMEQVEATILHPFLPLCIAGIGGGSGSGKTVLAAAVVRDATVRCRFGDRVFWLHAGKGANTRLISLLQALADTVYAWLTDSESGLNRGRARGSGGGGDSAGASDPNLREPVRFRDQDQAVNYVADLCRGPLLAELRCLVVLDDVHERDVVDAFWHSQCQLLVTSPDQALLQAVGAEATIAEPLGTEVAKQVLAGAAAETSLCVEADKVVERCRGCPLALAMSGAVAQAMLSAGTQVHVWRKPRLATPRTTEAGDSGGRGSGFIGRGWSLGNTFSNLTAPVGAWVEQVVVGTSSVPNRHSQANGAPTKEGASAGARTRRQGAAAGGAGDGAARGGASAGVGGGAKAPRLSPEATAWTNLADRIDRGLGALRKNERLREMVARAGREEETETREVVAVLTQVALEEADRILGGSGFGLECYLSFGILPEGIPLPPPALEELWLVDGAGTKGTAGGGLVNSGYAEPSRPPRPIEVFEALRMVGRAGGGEGSDGLILHGLQRVVVLATAPLHPDTMAKMIDRRLRVLSRISSLVGTFHDECWALGGRGGGGACEGRKRPRNGDGNDVGDSEEERIPAGLLASGRPGLPSHGYGGFSRYDYLVASWDALPAAHTLTAAAARYLETTRELCVTAAAKNGGGGGWAEARALAAAADLNALAGRGSEALPAYREACSMLEEEVARTATAGGVPQWQRSARTALHKVASMVQELAVFVAQLGKEAPAIRLLQRAVEMHMSVLEESGALVPDFGGGGREGQKLVGNGEANAAGGSAVDAAAEEESRGRGGGITCQAIAEDSRPLPLRLRLHPSPGAGEPSPSPSGRGGSCGGGGGGGGGAGGTLPACGRLDVVGTCVGDLGLVVACTRQLRQEKRVDESAQLAEQVYPVLKEILGADHAFTMAALAAFVGQGIVDECWSQSDANNAGVEHPALPSPTSRRRLARSYEGRGVSASGAGGGGSGSSVGGGGGGSGAAGGEKPVSSVSASTLSELSSPPSPLPEEFFPRYSSSFSATSAGESILTPSARANAGLSGGGRGSAGGRGVGVGARGGAAAARHRNRTCGVFSHTGSTSSGTDADDGEDSDGGPRSGGPGALRRAGRVGRVGGLPFQRRSLDRASLGWRGEGHGWQREVGSTAAARRGSLEPASTRMQQEFYFRHRTRRARAHAFLVTAATRARLKNADRAKAGLFLLDMARQAGATVGGPGGDGGLASPDGATQMAKLTRRR